MKRFLVIAVLALAAAALAVWFGMRSGSPKISSTTVTALLPAETLGLFHVPDVREARAQWHQSDLYKLWREPAIQEFLQKPLARNPKSAAASEKLQQFEALRMRDAFVAMVAWKEDRAQLVGGFRFQGSPEDVKRALPNVTSADGKVETQAYNQHRIEVTRQGAISIASVYSGDWFFAANDVAALQAVLDRADGRVSDPAATLRGNENFAASFRRMPRTYVAFAYGRLEEYFQKLTAEMPQNDRGNVARFREVRSFAAATGFENGKIRDVLYVQMPKAPDQPELTRASLTMTTAESFLYAASFMTLFPREPLSATQQTAGFAGVLQRSMAGLASSGVTAADWQAAFGPELGVVGEWPANARIPALLATVPVRDGGKARQILRAMTIGSGAEETQWALTESAGVQYAIQAPSSPMVPVAATIAVSDQLLIAGSDRTAVEQAITRGTAEGAALAGSQAFKAAERLVPEAKSAFVYLDMARFYTRLDAAIRPMLVLAATFVPSIAETVDLQKLPSPEIVTKHLSPIVLSQKYETDGYVTESVGPISIYHAGIGVALAAGFANNFYPGGVAATTAEGDATDSDASPLAPARSPSATAGPR